MKLKEGQVFKIPGVEYTITKDTVESNAKYGIHLVKDVFIGKPQIKLEIFKTLKNFIRIQNE